MPRDGVIRVLELRSVRGTGGGPEKTILNGAAKAGPRFHVTVCYLRDARDTVFGLDARAKALGVDYVEILERHSFDRRVVGRVAALVGAKAIDVIHAHEYKTDALALWLARRMGVHALATAHGWTGESPRERYVYYPADRFLLGRYRRVVAVSTEIRDRLVRAGARPERLTVLLNAIDPDAFRRDTSRRAPLRAALGLHPDDIVVASVGRAERQKRFDLFLAGLRPVLRREPRVRAVIVGDGSLLADLQSQAAALGFGDRCLFLGHRTDVADLHNAFDVFVQSSEYEGTPNAVLEAMAMGTPLVATDVGGTRELAADGRDALLIPSLDTAALGRAVEQVLADPDRAHSRAAAARQRVEQVLSFDARTRRLEQIYEEVVRA